MKNWMFVLAIFTFIIFAFLMYSFGTPTFVNFDKEMASLVGGNKFIDLFHYLGETKFIFSIGILLIIFFISHLA